MNIKQKKRFLQLFVLLILIGTAVALILFALKKNIDLFYTPTQLLLVKISPEQTIKLGGYVKEHSIHFSDSGQGVTFIITDKTNELTVFYQGILPNLFREKQGVVVTGKLQQTSLLMATQVLAKHDEKYMPPVLKEASGKGDSL